MKQAQNEVQNLNETVEEEQDSKSELSKQLAAAKAEAAQWKNKFETEINPRMEELEDSK